MFAHFNYMRSNGDLARRPELGRELPIWIAASAHVRRDRLACGGRRSSHGDLSASTLIVLPRLTLTLRK